MSGAAGPTIEERDHSVFEVVEYIESHPYPIRSLNVDYGNLLRRLRGIWLTQEMWLSMY